ncbi:unnamed protein product [Arabis nemorensis]|uniref:Uncharacterized protein n=1 Tax=Arabis nemorensis TaxID=586526 RepID=A0A565C4N1_9BRAS|nr:unnamed protein product [Arabis nemorensis]
MAYKRWTCMGRVHMVGHCSSTTREESRTHCHTCLEKMFTWICLMVETSAASFQLEGVRSVLVCQIVLQITNNQVKRETKPCAILVIFLPSDYRSGADSNIISNPLSGVGFAQCTCVATYGSLLLMQSPLPNLYILNLLTWERINLPLLESQLGKIKLELVDEESKDYVENIMWLIARKEMICGDQFLIANALESVMTCDGTIRISDFLRVLPREFPETDVHIVSGDVSSKASWCIRIFGMDPLTKKWENVDSLGDIAMFLDLGFTVRAKDIQ